MLVLINRKEKFMSKSTNYFGIPAFSNGSLSLNGQEKVTTSKKGDTVNSNFNLSEFEEMAFNYAQENFAKNLPKVNVFSSEVLKDINSQVDAFKNKAIKEIESVYEPMFTSLKNDIASRFGGFNNSSFLNSLDELEENKTQAISSLAQDVVAKKNELQNQEFARRYDFLNFLNDYQNDFYDNVLNYVSSSRSNSQLGNSYNDDLYSSYLYNQKLANDNAKYSNELLMSALSTMFL